MMGPPGGPFRLGHVYGLIPAKQLGGQQAIKTARLARGTIETPKSFLLPSGAAERAIGPEMRRSPASRIERRVIGQPRKLRNGGIGIALLPGNQAADPHTERLPGCSGGGRQGSRLFALARVKEAGGNGRFGVARKGARQLLTGLGSNQHIPGRKGVVAAKRLVHRPRKTAGFRFLGKRSRRQFGRKIGRAIRLIASAP